MVMYKTYCSRLGLLGNLKARDGVNFIKSINSFTDKITPSLFAVG